jgi:hypothetical protein
VVVSTLTILAVAAAAVIFAFNVWLLRRGILKEKYAVLWLFVSLVAIVLALFPGIVRWFSNLVGIEVPSNLLFFVTLLLLVLVGIQLSYELSRHEAKIRRLAEESALLSTRITELEERLGELEK